MSGVQNGRDESAERSGNTPKEGGSDRNSGSNQIRHMTPSCYDNCMHLLDGNGQQSESFAGFSNGHWTLEFTNSSSA